MAEERYQHKNKVKKTKLSYNEIVEEGDYDPKDSEHLQEGMTAEDEWAGRRLGDSAFSFLKAVSEKIGRKKHLFCTSTTILFEFSYDVCYKVKPIDAAFFSSITHFGNWVPFLLRVLPGCFLRGLKSLIDLDAVVFLIVIWCSILSIISMAGISNIFGMLAVIGLLAYVGAAPLAVIALLIYISVFLWLYGNFWATGSITIITGNIFYREYEIPALSIAAIYSIYCAVSYMGWSSVLISLGLSFITNDLIQHFLGCDIDALAEKLAKCQEFKPEEEISRLLTCKDHYAAFGYSRFEKIDVPSLKQKYHKKAILVHPDKHKGDERAVEAFKKLQNAYEVLKDSSKLKSYDDKLKTEEMFSLAQTFQRASLVKQIQTHFSLGRNHSEPVNEDVGENSRIIGCQKCGKFHTWAHRDRPKSRARWCQDCKDFHSAKDGDGWVEQHFHPIIFGLVQKLDTPHAYVCAESRIYEVTGWLICQGTRCQTNTHKPSFRINTNIIFKHSKGGTSSMPHGETPTSYMDESMADEAFFDDMQNAGRSSASVGSTSSESPSTSSGFKGSSCCGKKKKGKREW